MFTDDRLLPISALQHYTFCPRRAALVHLERAWADNRFTAEGNVLHAKAHDPHAGQSRPGVRICRGLELRSYRHGLTGKADVVEFHEPPHGDAARIVIVEYKRGRPKAGRDEPFRVQLCAQALCLEEMLTCRIEQGTLYFGQARHRGEVAFDNALRDKTLATIEAVHEILDSGTTPRARYEAKCRRCSLMNLCLPKAIRPRKTAARYLAQVVAEAAPDAPHDHLGRDAS